jgi:hypothetical protein
MFLPRAYFYSEKKIQLNWDFQLSASVLQGANTLKRIIVVILLRRNKLACLSLLLMTRKARSLP